jgi:uncharacterized YccA/Bax inhibitor family protein
MRTSNPALSEKVFTAIPYYGENAMTIGGTVNKTGLLLILAVISGTFTWHNTSSNPDTALPWIIGGGIGGFIVALVTIFKKDWAAVTAPIYALLEGLFLGAISALLEAQYKGIVSSAMILTFATMGTLLIAYRMGIIRATETFKSVVMAATGGIALFYVIALVIGFFGVNVPLIHSASPMGIGFSVFVVIIAALNLVLDFDFIEQGAANGAPKYMEWYAAFGLMVTLVWLYLEILRLLSKLNRNR